MRDHLIRVSASLLLFLSLEGKSEITIYDQVVRAWGHAANNGVCGATNPACKAALNSAMNSLVSSTMFNDNISFYGSGEFGTECLKWLVSYSNCDCERCLATIDIKYGGSLCSGGSYVSGSSNGGWVASPSCGGAASSTSNGTAAWGQSACDSARASLQTQINAKIKTKISSGASGGSACVTVGTGITYASYSCTRSICVLVPTNGYCYSHKCTVSAQVCP